MKLLPRSRQYLLIFIQSTVNGTLDQSIENYWKKKFHDIRAVFIYFDLLVFLYLVLGHFPMTFQAY